MTDLRVIALPTCGSSRCRWASSPSRRKRSTPARRAWSLPTRSATRLACSCSIRGSASATTSSTRTTRFARAPCPTSSRGRASTRPRSRRSPTATCMPTTRARTCAFQGSRSTSSPPSGRPRTTSPTTPSSTGSTSRAPGSKKWPATMNPCPAFASSPPPATRPVISHWSWRLRTARCCSPDRRSIARVSGVASRMRAKVRRMPRTAPPTPGLSSASARSTRSGCSSATTARAGPR